MEEPHNYEMVGNPSYAARESLQVKPSNTSAMKQKLNSTVDEKTSKLSKLAVATLIALFFVAMLAVSSIVIALTTYFNMRVDMEARITQLTQDFNTTKV